MRNFSPYITKEVGKTLAPEYGPESPSEAVDRLFKYYEKLGQAERTAFAAALIGELVTLKAMGRVRMLAGGGE